jgi:NAD(P) transhydrogenase subunit alpha
MTVTVAIPLETRPDERRVALIPKLVERLHAYGARVRIQAGAARNAGYHDEDWSEVEIVDDFASLVAGVDIVAKVAPPTLDEVAQLPRGSLLICLTSAFQHLDVIAALRERNITTLAMDHVPRMTRARAMNAVASQATIAGYKAALLAAELSPRLFPMLTTAAGTVKPALVVVIGAGVAGLQAIATARRLGARVEAYDIRRAARERIESLGASMIDTGIVAEGSDGLARALRRDERQQQIDVLGERLSKAHAVICAASIPGRPAPRIVTAEMVSRMLPDTVIVDMAAATGGNCELTRPGEQYEYGDVLISGPLNLPSHGAVHASGMYARNVVNLMALVVRDGRITLDPGDEIVARVVLTHAGHIHHLPTAGLLGVSSVPFGEIEHMNDEDVGSDDSDDWLSERDGSEETEGTAESVPVSVPASGSKAESGLAPVAELGESEPGPEPGVEPGVEPGPEQEPDDFTLIDGIGPALQKRLRGFGVRYFSDLAALDADGIERLAAQLELDDEIVQSDWVGQAARLASLHGSSL